MEKNPFSLYDFLGYLFPGLLSLLAIRYFIYTPCDDYFSTESFPKIFQWNESIEKWELIAVFVIFSYVAGHIISYLSSVVVEYFATRTFGYPSAYLLKKDNTCGHHRIYEKYFDTKRISITRLFKIKILHIMEGNKRKLSIQSESKSIIKRENRMILFIGRFAIALVMLPISCILIFLYFYVTICCCLNSL